MVKIKVFGLNEARVSCVDHTYLRRQIYRVWFIRYTENTFYFQ
jgi:hypothetical protein